MSFCWQRSACLAGVIYNIWSTVSFMRLSSPNAVGRMDLSDRATDFLMYGGNGPYLLPLAMLLICGLFRADSSTPVGRCRHPVVEDPNESIC